MNRNLISIMLLLLFTLSLTGLGRSAHAMTPPGTEIKNWASVEYSVGSVTYPPRVSNVTAFTVLELIEVKTEKKDVADIEVKPGDTNAVTTFLVTSSGNGVETFALSVNRLLLGDDFDPPFVSLYLDSDNDGLFDPSKDSRYVNDPSLRSLGSITVFVLCDIPAGLATSKIGQIELTATSRSGFGAVGEILPGKGDRVVDTIPVDAMLGRSGGQSAATSAYKTNVTEYPLTLTKNGSGSITTTTPSFACGLDCTTPQQANYPPASSVTITATPAAGQTFAGWTGACAGAGSALTCTVIMSQAWDVIATFVPIAAVNTPTGTIIINDGAATTTSPNVHLNLTGSDVEGVVAWYVSESATPPTAADLGWKAVTPIAAYSEKVPFILSSGDGLKTLYAWYKDADGHISPLASDTITLDSTPPAPTDKLLILNKVGDGTVLSAPGSIACSSGCSSQTELFPINTTVTLTATSLGDNIFSGWSGPCTGSAAICTVVMSEARLVTATFVGPNLPVGSIFINEGAEKTTSREVRLNLAGSDKEGIVGWFVSESATPPAAGDPNWKVVTPLASMTANHPFTLSPGDGVKTVYVWYRDADGHVSSIASDNIILVTTPPNPTDKLLSLIKIGEGQVNSTPGPIACGSGCNSQSEFYAVNTTVTLTATPAAGQLFTGWSGACTGVVTCTVVMSEARNVTATFSGVNLPVGNIVINNGAEWTAQPKVSLVLTASDKEGIVGWFVSESPIAPAALDPAWHVTSAFTSLTANIPFTLSAGDGLKTLYVWYRDADGHVSPMASDTIKLDATPPASSVNPPGGDFNAAVTVALTCDDGTGIGCMVIHYTTDGSIPTTASPIYNKELIFVSSTTLNFFALDKLGNRQAMQTEIYRIAAPELTSSIHNHQSPAFPYPVGVNIAQENLRHIPGSYHQGIIRSTNKRSDLLNQVEIVVPIGGEEKFCIDASKSGVERYLTLIDGTPASGLTLQNVLFSNDNGVTYSYTPTRDSESCDSAITHVKAQMAGTFIGTNGINHPYFELSFIGHILVGTPAGSILNYSVDMTYSVAGQAGALKSEATANVAELLNVVTTWQDEKPVVSAPGEKNVVTTFKVKNLGNGSEPFALNVVGTLPGEDFDPTPASIWIDSDNDGLFDATKDTRYIPGSNEPVIAAGASVLIFVLCDIPVPTKLGADYLGNVQLIATATSSGVGTPGTVVSTKGDGGVDAVIGHTGASSAAIGAYKVNGATVKVLKSVKIVSDPIGSTPPLPLTGSVLRYTLEVTAEGNGSVQSVVVTDRIPANTHYLPGSLTLDHLALSDADNTDAGTVNSEAVVVNVGTLSIADKRLVSFEVTID